MLPPWPPDADGASNVTPSVADAGAEPNLNVAGAVPVFSRSKSRRVGSSGSNFCAVAGAKVNESVLAVSERDIIDFILKE